MQTEERLAGPKAIKKQAGVVVITDEVTGVGLLSDTVHCVTARLNPAAVAAWIAFDEGSLDAAVAKYSRDLKIPDDEASNQLTRVFKKMRTNGWIDFDEPV